MTNEPTLYLERRHSLNARQARRQIKRALAAVAEREEYIGPIFEFYVQKKSSQFLRSK